MRRKNAVIYFEIEAFPQERRADVVKHTRATHGLIMGVRFDPPLEY